MENESGLNHLKPHILPPLGGLKDSNEFGKILSNYNPDKPLRQRIGTPAPQKKSPIPDDLDLDKVNGIRGNPAIRVDSCKSDEGQTNKYILEASLESLPEDALRSGSNNMNCRLSRKPQLQPIMNPIFNARNRDDLNGNELNARSGILLSEIHPPGKAHFPNKYTPLKPIVAKKSDFD